MKPIYALSELDLKKQYTYADYINWWFDDRVELIKGYIRKMSPGASRTHQTISTNIITEFALFLKHRKCKVFHAPFDVRLLRNTNDHEVTTVVQPDICIVCNEEYLEENGCNGAPTIIIEILSTSNSKHDLVTKFKLYEEAKVGEYWIVYPYEKVLDVYHLQGDNYALFKKYVEDELIDVKSLAGLTISLKDIFEI
ncbi:MAG TPA: Uma2 family endonuclease [Cytophagaceae bacterium]|jgi:Uma2 family endonuclease